jgi:predicted DNA-binding transcriptional regulator AlpA
MGAGRMSETAYLHSVPTLDEIASDTRLASSLPADLAATLAVRAASALCALQIAATRPPARTTDEAADDLLDSAALAALLNVSKSWVDHNLRKLPQARMIGSKRRWRRSDVRRWMTTR